MSYWRASALIARWLNLVGTPGGRAGHRPTVRQGQLGADGETNMLTTRVPRDWQKQQARPRVLVIDDDDDIADVLRQSLTEEGYAVATVPHGAAALDILKLHEPEVILLDLRKPFDIDDVIRAIEHARAAC